MADNHATSNVSLAFDLLSGRHGSVNPWPDIKLLTLKPPLQFFVVRSRQVYSCTFGAVSFAAPNCASWHAVIWKCTENVQSYTTEACLGTAENS